MAPSAWRLQLATGALAVLLSLQLAVPARAQPAATKQPAEPAVIWTGGDIITMAGRSPQYVQALVTRGGKIVYTGDKAGAVKAAGAGAVTRDLGGKTLIPGFSDSHGHMLLAAHTLMNAQLTGVKSIDEIVSRLKEHAKDVPAGAWIEGMGFRFADLKEGRWPTKEDLDKVSTTQPVFIQDGGGHHAVVNSAWLKMMGVTKDTKDPPGGVYYRKPGTTEPDGHLAESTAINALAKRPPMPPEMVLRGIKKATDLWVENGYTTAMELGAGGSGDDWTFINALVDKKLLPIDLILVFKASTVPAAEAAAKDIMAKYKVKSAATAPLGGPRTYLNRVRVQGIKFWMDGSNPTALTSQPYLDLNDPANKHYYGIQNDRTADLDAAMDKYWKNGLMVVDAHALGDQAIELVIQAMEKAYAKQGPTTKRHVIQHAALLRPDQIKRIAKLNQTVSFTGGMLGAMPDYHIKMFGQARANMLNPAKSMEAAGVVWGLNSDYPAGPGQDSFLLVQDQVVRDPKIGPQERVSPYSALRAMTYNNAYINNEDRVKGSLEPGKLADMIVLDRNPLKVAPTTIRQTKVLETIKEGKTIYKRPAAGQLPETAPPPTAMEMEEGVHPPPPKGTPKLDAAQAAGVAKLLGATAGARR